jgi:hypothetical protein
MRTSIESFIRQVPGNSINEKLPSVAHALGLREGRVNEYRHRKINRPYADEVWAVLNHAERIAAGVELRAELRRNNEDLKNAFSGVGDPARRQDILLRIAGHDEAQRNVGGGRQEFSEEDGVPPSALGRFAGGILDVQEIGLSCANRAHQQLVEAVDQTAGEFTVGISQEMGRLGLESLAWLYRAEHALPALHVGDGIAILSSEDRARLINRPIEEQPLPPFLLSTVASQLRACMREKARPAVHRISASIGGKVHTWDRLAVHFPASNLVVGSCLLVAA